jgi:hypothetical protein
MTTRKLIRQDLRLAEILIQRARRYGSGEYRESCATCLQEAMLAISKALIEIKEGK